MFLTMFKDILVFFFIPSPFPALWFGLVVLFHFQQLCIMHAHFSKANKSSAAH